jgi:signal transduction histidine kinase
VSGRLRAAIPPRTDIAITLVVAVFVVMVTEVMSYWHSKAHLSPFAVIWLIGGPLPLLWRRRWPLTVFIACAVLVLSYYQSGFQGGPSAVAVGVALVSLAYFRGHAIGIVAAAAVFAVTAALTFLAGDKFGITDPRLFGTLVTCVAMVAIGAAARTRRAAIVAGRERSEERTRREAEEQRLRIAREVHDVVAHSLAMINVQAGVGAHVADRRPEQAKEALLAIKEASRSALVDLRATLNVLRAGEDMAPIPGLDRLADLVGAASSAGLAVTVRGEPGELPAPVNVAAYRILQESLTNVVRHAAAATAVRIEFERTDEGLGMTVQDNGDLPAAGVVSGNGLRGMAERAHALGGTATSGPGETGGFEVRLWLPLTGGSVE